VEEGEIRNVLQVERRHAGRSFHERLEVLRSLLRTTGGVRHVRSANRSDVAAISRVVRAEDMQYAKSQGASNEPRHTS
jgi:hypothetical protein